MKLSETNVAFLLLKLVKLTNRLHCNSQHDALMNELSVIILTIGEKEFGHPLNGVEALGVML